MDQEIQIPAPETSPVVASKPNKTLFLVLGIVLLMVLTSVVTFAVVKSFTPQEKPTIVAPNPTQNQTVPDKTANWKLYSGLRVSFKYPADVFIYQAAPQTQAQYWASENGGSPMDLSNTAAWMNLSITSLDTAGYNTWSKTVSSTEWTISSDLPKANSETAYAYSALQLKDKTLYKFSIAAKTNETLLKYHEIFDQILSTFKFIDQSSEGTFCGGIAGKPCATGYSCKLDGNYPDAGGKCIKN